MEGEDAAGHQGHHEGETQAQSETQKYAAIHQTNEQLINGKIKTLVVSNVRISYQTLHDTCSPFPV